MASKKVINLPADALYMRWQENVERIRTELHYVFSARWGFREVSKLFESNTQLRDDGHHIYDWLLGMWGRDAIIGVRRELDDQGGVVNLVHLLYEIEARPELLNRSRYLAHLEPEDETHVVFAMGEYAKKVMTVLTPNASGSGLAHIDPAIVKEDREKLQNNTQTVFRYAQQMVAHRTPLEQVGLQVKDIHEAIDAIEPPFLKYYNLLTAKGLTKLEPSVVYYWHKPFTYPWIPQT